MNKEELLGGIQQQYSLIYSWHRRFGIKKFREKWAKDSGENDWTHRYYELVENLKEPPKADIEYIGMIAKEVLSGSMEWSYSETVDEEVSLSHIAKSIRKAIDDYVAGSEDERIEDSLSNFENLGKKGEKIRPNFIAIPIRHGHQWNAEEYFSNAERAYHDIPLGEDNVGGRIVLMETNMEVTKGNAKHYGFYNSKALHFDLVTEETSLVKAAKKKTIVIESITLGS